MGWDLEARHGLRRNIVLLAATAAALVSTNTIADARYHHRVRVLSIREAAHHRARAESYAPPSASIVLDGNTAEVLQAANADALRHPASLTKIMTLYLLFERLEAGKIKLDTPLKVSEHASEQAPTKLGLKPGQTIAVEDAIKAVVTKSANDAAVAIGENLGGDEDEFAKLMTQKAHALGMSHTTYVNASGLPDDDQNTTARDQATLGRAIQERFPHYYKYFSTEEFVYRGHEMRNHNHLLGVVSGVDGIKTGYTRASGFNLVTSVHRDGRYIVAVVLGGHSASERDARMRELIGAHIKEASLQHSAPVIAEKTEQRGEPQPIAFSAAPLSSHAEPAAAASATPHGRPTAGSNDPIQPLVVRTITYRTAPPQTTALAPLPNLVPAAAQSPQPAAAAAVHAAPASQATETPGPMVIASTEPAPVVTSGSAEAAKPGPTKAEVAKADIAKAEVAKAAPTAAQTHARGGWLIQIGAFDGEDEAKQHLSAAQLQAPTILATADAFTERVQKGDKALYRARFASFDKATAEAACKQLKRSDIECMAVKN
jgi:D-alanyl-D-alanine carboxypeptidase